jgi:hypothetical protein
MKIYLILFAIALIINVINLVLYLNTYCYEEKCYSLEVWKLIVFILLMFIPIINIFVGIILMWHYFDDDYGILMFKNKTLNKILDFLNKDLNE